MKVNEGCANTCFRKQKTAYEVSIRDWSTDVCSSDRMLTTLEPWGERKGSENSSVTLVGKANSAFMAIKEALVFALNPPAIQELGTASGFTFKLEDVGGKGEAALIKARNQLLAGASQSPLLTGVKIGRAHV